MCWIALFDARILLLLLRNNELTWAKSIKLISCCNEEWLELNLTRLSAKGLNFSLAPKYLDYADCLVNFELFYRNIRNLGILSNEDLDFVKTRTKEAALSSYRNYNNNVPQHLSKEYFLFYKIYVKIKILLSRNLINVILL